MKYFGVALITIGFLALVAGSGTWASAFGICGVVAIFAGADTRYTR